MRTAVVLGLLALLLVLWAILPRHKHELWLNDDE